jgi:hypothetical protein
MKVGLLARGPSLHGRRWPRIAGGLLLMTVSAAWLALTVSWTLDVVGGHEDTRAVITVNQRTDLPGRHHNGHYTLQARTDDGTDLDLDSYAAQSLYASLDTGDPVVVTRSTITGDVTAIRTALDYVHAESPISVILLDVIMPLVLPLLILVPVRNLLYRVPRLAVIGVPVLAFAVSATLLFVLGNPVLPAGQPAPPPAAALNEPDTPQRVVAANQPVTTDNVAVTLTGPVNDSPPAGAAPWVHGFAMASIPVSAKLLGPDADGDQRGYLNVRLVGDGIGNADGLRPASCTHQAVGFGDSITIDEGTTATGVLCFLLPTHFRPHYLVLVSTPDGNDVSAIDLTRPK